MSALRLVSNIARTAPRAFAARRGYAEAAAAASDKIKLSLVLPHEVHFIMSSSCASVIEYGGSCVSVGPFLVCGRCAGQHSRCDR